MSLDILASVPPSAGFPLRRFFSGHGRLIVGDGGRLHSPDEEDVGVEWCGGRGDLLSVLLRGRRNEKNNLLPPGLVCLLLPCDLRPFFRRGSRQWSSPGQRALDPWLAEGDLFFGALEVALFPSSSRFSRSVLGRTSSLADRRCGVEFPFHLLWTR
jgi:hypothetical protein